MAAILEGVTAALQAGIPRPSIELLFTYAEERQHVGARRLDTSRLTAQCCFTLDASGPIGTLITGAPTYYSLRATFQGRAAHAGIAPETGINALVAASRAIARMPLGRVDSETTANGGSDANDLNEKGIPTVVVATGMEDPHTVREHVAVEDLVRAARLVCELLSA